MITRFQARRAYLNFSLEMVGRIPPTVDYGLRVKGGDMVGTTDDSLFYIMPPETNIYLIPAASSQVSRTPRQYSAYFPQSTHFYFIPRSLNPLPLQKPIPTAPATLANSP